MRILVKWALIALIITVTAISLSNAGKALKHQLTDRVNTINASIN